MKKKNIKQEAVENLISSEKELIEKLKEIQQQKQQIVTDLNAKIDELCEKENCSAGVTLTRNDLHNIIKFFFENPDKKEVWIKYNIVFNEVNNGTI